MSVVDNRGRIGGRVNVIDAVMVIVVLVLIPAAYGAYLLFRNPPPKLLGVTPPRMFENGVSRVQIEGRDLRPFMRVSFNNAQGRTFLIGSTKSAVVDLPDLAAGTYDVVLYDYSQEVDRLPKGFTVVPRAPLPTVDMDVGGVFIGLSDAVAAQMKPGVRFPPTGGQAELLAVGAPVPGRVRIRAGEITLPVPVQGANDVPATLRVKCSVTPNPDGSLGCTMFGPKQPAAVAPDSRLELVTADGSVNFQIGDVHLPSSPASTEAHVRFVVTPELMFRMKAGDVDSGSGASSPLHQARLVMLGASRSIAAAEAGPLAPLGGVLRVVDAILRVPVEPVATGWMYKERPFKVGAPITFETAQYVVHGEIVETTPPSVTPRAAGASR